MNCKPGDLAVIVRSPDYIRAEGVIVRCLELTDGWLGPLWKIHPPVHDSYSFVHDCWLRPIRDPGDDATDETLEWLPVPGKAVTA